MLFRRMPGKLDRSGLALAYTFRAASIREHNPLPFLLQGADGGALGYAARRQPVYHSERSFIANAREHGLLQNWTPLSNLIIQRL